MLTNRQHLDLLIEQARATVSEITQAAVAAKVPIANEAAALYEELGKVSEKVSLMRFDDDHDSLYNDL